MPTTIAISIADERKLERRRHPLEDQAERGRAVDERAAEVAVQRRAREAPVLRPGAACRGRARAIARSRSAWSACGLIRMSIGLPIA